MQSEQHERARFLIDRAPVAALSNDEQCWLNRHMEICVDCSKYAELSRRIIRGLKSFSFDANPGMNARVQQAVTIHAMRLAVKQSRTQDLFVRAARRVAERVCSRPLRWILVASALLVVLAVPIYRAVKTTQREAEMERADALLLERVDSELSRAVPAAMEPLVQAATWGLVPPKQNESSGKAVPRDGGNR